MLKHQATLGHVYAVLSNNPAAMLFKIKYEVLPPDQDNQYHFLV